MLSWGQLRSRCVYNSILRLATLFFIKLSLTEAINEKQWHAFFLLIFMSFVDEAIIRSIISLRNDQLRRVCLQKSDHKKPNHRSKYGGFLSFELVVNDLLFWIKLLSLSVHFSKKERFLSVRS